MSELNLKFDRDVRTMQLESTATAPLQVVRLSYDQRSGRFEASLELPESNIARALPLRFAGTAVEVTETAVLTRPMSRGEIVRQADIVMTRKVKAEAGSDVVSESKLAVGMSLRRPMAAGQMLKQADLMKPELVQRNEGVTLVFEMPGIMLTSRGKALDSGAEGDVVSVLNIQSKRTVQGIVTGIGTVTVTSATPRFANLTSYETAGPASSANSRTE